ncbi:MAG TPA: hypothetical protein VFQ61_09845 [Polyangiaceae bacterium]|nr:hypothetical protein [Polyangiaceae bacterium]
MCLICIDFDRGALKPKEARRALREMRSQLDPDHAREVEQKLDLAGEQAARDPAASSGPPASRP